MEWAVIRTNKQYIRALRRVILLMDSTSGTPEAKELEKLLGLLKQFEQSQLIFPTMAHMSV